MTEEIADLLINMWLSIKRHFKHAIRIKKCEMKDEGNGIYSYELTPEQTNKDHIQIVIEENENNNISR